MRLFCRAVLCLLLPATAMAAEPWELVLRKELEARYRCALARVIYSREIEIGSRRSFEGRIACVDGREVDFSRADLHSRFELKLCQPTVC